MYNKIVFWGISHSGKNREVLQLIREARKNDITTIGMTQLGGSDLEKAVQYVLQTSRTEDNQKLHISKKHKQCIVFLHSVV